MSAIASVLRELWGLFVEDASLTIAIILCLVLASLVFPRVQVPAPWRGALLFVLLALALIENVRRSARS